MPRRKDKLVHLKWLLLCDPCYLKHMRQNPWSGNYRNRSALKTHYEDQSEETEDQSPFQGEEGGDEVMTHQFSKFADLRENEKIPIELPDKTTPTDGDDLDRDQTIQESEASDQLRDQREQRKRGRLRRGSQPQRAENQISSRTRSRSLCFCTSCVYP